jgi:hypothetical protein
VRKHLALKGLTIVLVGKDASKLAADLVQGAPSPPAYESPKAAEVVARDRAIAAFPLGLAKDRVQVVTAAALFEK